MLNFYHSANGGFSSLYNYFYLFSTATPVTIGLQKTSYSVYETDEYQVVCAEVLSGDIAGRSIDISYTTEGDTAEGMLTTYLCF